MRSLELLEELNKLLIDAKKRCQICYDNVGEKDKERCDLDHDLLNTYMTMSAKEKREYTDKYFECLAERHNNKYEYRELEILKTFYETTGLEQAFNETLNKLRKLNQEQEQPIYYKRAKKNKGEIVVINKEGDNNGI